MTFIKNALLTMLIYHASCVMPAVIWGYPLWRQHVVLPSIKQWLLVIVSSIVFCSFTLLLYDKLGDRFLSNENALAVIREQGFTKESFWFLGLYFVFVNSTLEELYWRGVLLNKLDQLGLSFKHFGIIWSSLTYGAFHYSIFRLILRPVWAEIGIIMLMFYGAGLALLYRKTGSIVLPIIAHALLTDLAAILLMVSLFLRLGIPFY